MSFEIIFLNLFIIDCIYCTSQNLRAFASVWLDVLSVVSIRHFDRGSSIPESNCPLWLIVLRITGSNSITKFILGFYFQRMGLFLHNKTETNWRDVWGFLDTYALFKLQETFFLQNRIKKKYFSRKQSVPDGLRTSIINKNTLYHEYKKTMSVGKFIILQIIPE